MNVVLLHPTDVARAHDEIIENIKKNPVFVVTAEEELCDYIPKLKQKEKIQSRMRICKQQKINVLLKKDEEEKHFSLLSELLEAIDLGGKLGNFGGLAFFILLLASFVFFTTKKNKK